MIIDAVVWKLEHTTVEETVIGDYARLVAHKMIKRDFDLNHIDNRFHLAERSQVKLFAKFLLQNYVEVEHDKITLKLAPVILCLKLGQIQVCFDLVYKTQGGFRDEF